MRTGTVSLSVTFVLIISAGTAFAAGEIIVDHDCADLWAVPEAAIAAAKTNLHIAYGHTSHGSQLIAGLGTSGGAQLDAFMSANGATPGLYRWNAGGTGGALDLRDRPFSGAQDLGNPNRTAWEAATRNYLDANPECNVILWSWCGQAATSIANIDIYLNLMEGLIADYPGVAFVFMTGHLDGTGESGTLNLANQHIRNHCRTHGRILYDFADIESYDPDGLVHYLPLGANDNCDYDSDGNGSRDRNWATDWQSAHTEGVHWWASGAAHSQHLNGNRKGYAAWHLFARLAGWEPGGPPPPPPPPPGGPAPKVRRVDVVGGRRPTGLSLSIDARVRGTATGCRVWEDLPGAAPPEFTPGTPVADHYRALPLTLSSTPGLTDRRTICFQAERDGELSEVRKVRLRLASPRMRKIVIQGGKKRSDPSLVLDLLVRGEAVGYRVWEDVPGAVPPPFTNATSVFAGFLDVAFDLSGQTGLPQRRVVYAQVTGKAGASKVKRVVVVLR